MPKQKLNPLPAAAFQILMSLADDDLHGYEIMRRVEEQTDGRTRIGYYRITAAGRKAARDEAERLADVLRVARAKKILRGEYV